MFQEHQEKGLIRSLADETGKKKEEKKRLVQIKEGLE